MEMKWKKKKPDFFLLAIQGAKEQKVLNLEEVTQKPRGCDTAVKNTLGNDEYA